MKEVILEALRAQFPGSDFSVQEFRDELTILVAKSDIAAVAGFLRDHAELRFDSLRDVCGADYYRPDDRFEVIYNLYSLNNNLRLRLKVRVDENDPYVPTVTGVWQSAHWYERETYDMFGIIFVGHPDLRRMYMPEDFVYYPLRKDFPLMGIPGSLSLPHK